MYSSLVSKGRSLAFENGTAGIRLEADGGVVDLFRAAHLGVDPKPGRVGGGHWQEVKLVESLAVLDKHHLA